MTSYENNKKTKIVIHVTLGVKSILIKTRFISEKKVVSFPYKTCSFMKTGIEQTEAETNVIWLLSKHTSCKAITNPRCFITKHINSNSCKRKYLTDTSSVTRDSCVGVNELLCKRIMWFFLVWKPQSNSMQYSFWRQKSRWQSYKEIRLWSKMQLSIYRRNLN